MNKRAHTHGCRLVLVAALCGCLETSGREDAGYSSELLGPDANVASLDSDEAQRARLDMNDMQETTMISLRTGYVAGQEIRYWDFGAVPMGTKSAFIFRRRGADGKPQDFGHPDLIDSVPGDANHTSFRTIYTVYVKAAYAGQQITSPQALEDALELGLLEAPEWKDSYANWPVVLQDARMEVGPDEAPVSPHPAYYRGRLAHHFKLEDARGPGLLTIEKPPIPWPNVYLLRRQNETRTLDEGVWRADLNADGDSVDTNVVFSYGPADMSYTSLWKQVDVVVPPDYAWADSRAESDLFEKQMTGLKALPGAVVEYQDSILYLNRPIQRSAE
jgi:hypothetical protein